MKSFTIKDFWLIVVFVVIPYCFLPLEYNNFKLKSLFQAISWISIAVIGTRILTRNKSYTKTIILTLGGTIYGAMTCWYLLGFVLCAWTSNWGMYANKKNKSIKIVCRTYGCYGTTDSCELFKERQLTKNLKWVTRFNENSIDTAQWESIKAQ